ncbi:MAG: phosphatidylserine/phosphatidylglycerophosphate/cardiolipin synthase family protein [Deltaproteobacteria bacterium]|nr:phosphatidylserine/phosphatidylglycerophosphate/cardiolipin synthase family protein [Deltaproteobacteria bacterium]
MRVQALIFKADEAGLHIAEILKEKKKAGLDVRVIVDAASNMDWRTQWMYFDLKKHGIEVEGYEALYLHWLSGEIDPKDPLRANKRFHDKMWIVDAEDEQAGRAIVGGLNLANEYFRVDSEPINRWTDQDVILRGPIVDDVVAVFDRNYDFFKELKDKRPGLLNTDNSWKLTRDTLKKIKDAGRPSWRRPELVEAIDDVLAKEATLEYAPLTGRFLQSRPRLKETFIRQAYDDLIGRAEKTVFIANAYFIPSRDLTERLKAAARRGVRVVILSNSPATNDIRPVALVSRHTYKELLLVNEEEAVRTLADQGAGLEIYEWSGAPFDEGTLHAKFMVTDGTEAIVGSYNLDPRSERLNSETALALRSDVIGGKLQHRFEKELLPKATRITMEQAKSFRKPKGLDAKFELLFALPLKKWL